MGNKASVVRIKKAIEILSGFKSRPAAPNGRPGGLVELNGKRKPIIIGDLHANLEHLQLILSDEENHKQLKAGRAVVIILGDALHNDQTYYLREMQSSLLMLEYLLDRILEFPGNFLYLRGNHDTFDDQLVKNFIHQGTELKKLLIQERGESYVEAVQEFFDSLPLFVIGNHFCITHAGPVRQGLSRKEIIQAVQHPDWMHQLTWNRINEFQGTPSAKEYGKDDIYQSLQKLNLSLDTHFIVGHNPLWNTGNTSGVWLNVLGIPNHHILYSGWQTRAPYFTFEDGELIVHHAISVKKEILYV